MSEKVAFTTKEAAEYLGISCSTLWRWRRIGLIASARAPGGQRRFSRESIEVYLEKSRAFEAPKNPSKYKKSAEALKETGASNPAPKINTAKELQRVYAEMSSWSEINKELGVIPGPEVFRRELLFLLQQVLYRIKDARKEGDKNKESFNSTLYYLTKSARE